MSPGLWDTEVILLEVKIIPSKFPILRVSAWVIYTFHIQCSCCYGRLPPKAARIASAMDLSSLMSTNIPV
jgi:hypothetical protein